MRLPTTGDEFAQFLKGIKLTQSEFAVLCGKCPRKGIYWAKKIQQSKSISKYTLAIISLGYYRFKMQQLENLKVPEVHMISVKAEILDDMMASFSEFLC